ncbi:MAG: ribonuclease HII, partial [Blastocatellia bacterium]|nr:ribonuclease HII [Blastocatellia bacterium]
NDSKKLTKKQRERLSTEILESALSTSISFIEPQEIDRINIHKAALFAMAEAIESLKIKPDFLLIDGFSLPSTGLPQKAVIKGDESVVSIAAASIIAKVERDRIMTDYNKIFPGYGFDRNVGYGTAEHLNALQKLGATQIHRKSFKGVTSQ